MIFQDPTASLNPVFSIGDQITSIIRHHEGKSKEEAENIAKEALTAVGLPSPAEIMNSYPFELSDGMQQRVMIAIALSSHPELLIADEPTTALDVTIQAQILRLIRELRLKFNTSMILISHDLGVVHKSCDRMGILYAGNLMEICDKQRLFSNPLHPYTKGLLGAIPKIKEDREKLSVIRGSLPDIKNLAPGCRFEPRCTNSVSRCKKEKPPLSEIEPGHWVACYHLN